jgi:hypothetical protein
MVHGASGSSTVGFVVLGVGTGHEGLSLDM